MFLWIWFIITNHTAKESIKVLSYWYYDKDTTSSRNCNLNQRSPLTTKRHIWRKKTKHHLEYVLFYCHIIPGIIMHFTFIITMNSPNYVLSNTLYAAAAAAKSLQSCPTLCDCIDGSQPGSLVPGILQARALEWAAISFSNAWKWKVKVKSLSRVRLVATPWTTAYQAPPSMGFSRQEYWSGYIWQVSL